MKLSAAVKRAMGPRSWSWCRRPNGFSDLPKWRVLAKRLQMPLTQVVAFVNRLEELANDAGNKGLARGEVTHFSAAEFAIALDITEREAKEIFDGLGESGIDWVVDGHIADFYDRNRDKEDDTAAVRQQRRRVRTAIMGMLAQLARADQIEPPARLDIEIRLRLMDDDALAKLRRAVATALATGHKVTRDVTEASRRDVVTVTPEKSTQVSIAPGDNSGDDADGEAPGLAREEADRMWLQSDGRRAVADQLLENEQLAAAKIGRWLDQEMGGDAAALVRIIQGAIARDFYGARFLNAIVDGIRAAQRSAAPQGELVLPVVIGGERRRA
jgi:hypothetical protein